MTARALASCQFERTRSSSYSAIESMIRSTRRPVSVRRSNPSCTLANVPPASWMRSMSCSPSTSERPKRSSLATTIPSEWPAFDPFDGSHEERPVLARPGLVELLEDLADLVVERLHPREDPVALLGRADEARTGAPSHLADADVGVELHGIEGVERLGHRGQARGDGHQPLAPADRRLRRGRPRRARVAHVGLARGARAGRRSRGALGGGAARAQAPGGPRAVAEGARPLLRADLRGDRVDLHEGQPLPGRGAQELPRALRGDRVRARSASAWRRRCRPSSTARPTRRRRSRCARTCASAWPAGPRCAGCTMPRSRSRSSSRRRALGVANGGVEHAGSFFVRVYETVSLHLHERAANSFLRAQAVVRHRHGGEDGRRRGVGRRRGGRRLRGRGRRHARRRPTARRAILRGAVGAGALPALKTVSRSHARAKARSHAGSRPRHPAARTASARASSASSQRSSQPAPTHGQRRRDDHDHGRQPAASPRLSRAPSPRRPPRRTPAAPRPASSASRVRDLAH